MSDTNNKKVKELKDEILKALEKNDIATLYVMEKRAYDTFDEDTLQDYYSNILDLALENLTNTLESARVMDMNEVQDFATIRALYEYAMEHYHAGKLNDAAALFEVLSGISNDEKFSQALKVHKEAATNNITLDYFMDKLADIEATEASKTFYISAFTKEVQNLLNKTQNNGE